MGLLGRWFDRKKYAAYPFAPYISSERSEEIQKAMLQEQRAGGDCMNVLRHRYGILYIEPKGAASTDPVADGLTRKITAAFRRAAPSGIGSCGVHVCICGSVSSAIEHILPQGIFTNALCIHYMAFHRSEVPQKMLETVAAFTTGEAEPSVKELQQPRIG